jgi:hypothetical protein
MKQLEKIHQTLMWVGPLCILLGAVLSNEHKFQGTPLLIIGLVFLVLGFLHIKNLLVSKVTLGIVIGLAIFFLFNQIFLGFKIFDYGMYRGIFYLLGLVVTLAGNIIAFREMLRAN